MLTDMLTAWSKTAFVLVAMSTGMCLRRSSSTFDLYTTYSYVLYQMNDLASHKSNIEILRLTLPYCLHLESINSVMSCSFSYLKISETFNTCRC